MACGDLKARFRGVILDPALTASVPGHVAAASGIDAVAHAVESYVCTKRNAVSRMYALEAWRLLATGFEASLAPAADPEARAAMLLGAHFAGAAIENAMLGAAHACANPLTARYGITHGVAVGVMLPPVIRFNGETDAARYEGFGMTPGALADRIERFARVAKLPARLRELRVERDRLPELAEDAARQWTGTFNPRTGPVKLTVWRYMKMRIEFHARRKVGRGWNIFLILCILYIPVPVCVAAETSWPLFRGDAQSTGLARESLPESLHVAWTARVPEGIESTAAIGKGAVFVGGLDGNLYAFDFDTGALKWKYPAGGEIKASPLVAANAVFFGDGDGGFHAVDASTGKGLWTYRTGGEIISSATAHEGRVIFGSYDQFLYCLNADDGSLVWKLETEGYVHGTPAIWGERVLVAGCDGLLRMVNAVGGDEVSRVELYDYVAASVAVRNGRAYAGTFGNQVLGMDLRAAKVLWRYEHPSRKFPYYASPAVTTRSRDCRRARQDGARASSGQRRPVVDSGVPFPSRLLTGCRG